jgi:hypothetical protein
MADGGAVRIGRQAHHGHGTYMRVDGAWRRQPTTTTFPLLEAVSVSGAEAQALTRQLATLRAALA